MKKKLEVKGNINSIAQYLGVDELVVLSIFDIDTRKPVSELEVKKKDLGRKKPSDKTTNKSKTI